MKRSMVVVIVLLLSVVITAQRGGPSPEQQAAMAKQEALEKATPQLQVTEEVLRSSIPGHTIGEAVGVAKNSKGHLFVFTRSGNAGPAKGATASQLFEFDPNLKFVKQWGPGQLRRVVRAHRPRRQGRQRLDDRRRREHGRQVQPAGQRGDGARPKDRSDRLSRAASPSAARRTKCATRSAAPAPSTGRPT